MVKGRIGEPAIPLAVEADASREEVLEKVRIDRARGLIAAVGTDAENVYTVLTARLMRPDLFIIGRAETDDARRKLTRAGADGLEGSEMDRRVTRLEGGA